MRYGFSVSVVISLLLNSSLANAALNYTCTNESNGTQQLYANDDNGANQPILTIVGESDEDREIRCFNIAKLMSDKWKYKRKQACKFECDPIIKFGLRVRLKACDKYVVFESKGMGPDLSQKVCESYAKQLNQNLSSLLRE